MRTSLHHRHVGTGRAHRRLVRLLILLRSVEDEARTYLREGHGPDCPCHYCTRDDFGADVAADVQGWAWAAGAAVTTLESQLVLFGLDCMKARIEGRPMTRRGWFERNRRELLKTLNAAMDADDEEPEPLDVRLANGRTPRRETTAK